MSSPPQVFTSKIFRRLTVSFNYHFNKSRKIINIYLSMVKEEADKWLEQRLKKEPTKVKADKWLEQRLKKEPTKVKHIVKDMLNDKSK
jgi:hypothetical protein